jgi:hypothetical protein
MPAIEVPPNFITIRAMDLRYQWNCLALG